MLSDDLLPGANAAAAYIFCESRAAIIVVASAVDHVEEVARHSGSKPRPCNLSPWTLGFSDPDGKAAIFPAIAI